MSLNYISDTFDDIYIIKVKLSRATLKEAGELLQILNRIVKLKYDKIIIELDEVEFIDSTFLGTLTLTQKKLNEYNGNLVLTGLSPDVDSIVKRANLTKVFNIFETRFDAFKFLSLNDDGNYK